jgi:hypothetical protein
MSNKQPQKQPKITIQGRVNAEIYTEYLKLGELLGIKQKTLILEPILTTYFLEHSTSKPLEQTPSKVSIPEEIKAIFQTCKKKGCLAYPYFDSEAQEGICVFPFEGKEPKISRRSIAELKACSDTPILVSMARKKELEEEFQYRTETLIAQIDRGEKEHLHRIALMEKLKERDQEHLEDVAEIHRLAHKGDDREKVIDKLRRQLQPMQEIIKAKEGLESEVKKMKNGLLERIEENNTLQNDNEYLRRQNEELSHDTLIEKTKELTTQLEDAKQYVKVQEAQKNREIGELKADIRQLEALNEKEIREKAEISSKIRSFLRDAKQSIPTYGEAEGNLLPKSQIGINDALAFQVAKYLGNIRKLIENLEGYLNTIAS